MNAPRRVVVTGVGVVSPIGSGQAAFLRGLREARPGVAAIERFDASAFPTRVAGEVRDLPLGVSSHPERFAAGLGRDPKARYGLAAGLEALRQAFGGDHDLRATDRLPYAPDQRAVLLAAGLEIFHLEDLLPFLRPGGPIDGAALLAEVGQHPVDSSLQIPADLGARALVEVFDARGGYAINLSACAAGSQAIGAAFRAVRSGEVCVALTGGYDSMVNPLGVAGFSLLQAMSTQNERGGAASRPFDVQRDGFVLGEGAAMLVLEAREAALERGATVLGEICGYASSLDAFRVTDPAPDQRGAIAAMRGAIDDADLAPEAIGYVNAHGTATRKNDPAESAALRAVFGEHLARLPVSSTKSQIGHLIGAAGAVEAAATLLSLEQGFLPATINLDSVDPECAALDHVRHQPREAWVRLALSNSFGFGGQNASLVLGGSEHALE
jgi:3-oxoacyl-[acyl-carrier-protein] synthase II